MLETLKIGLVVKPQGIRGELKVEPLTDDINRFKKLKEVIIDDKTYKITKVVVGAGAVFVSLFGISDRNVAETFRGKFLRVTRDNAVPLEEGRYFIADIIGCKLFTETDEEIGEVAEVTSARTDIFTITCLTGKIMRFPFLKDLIISVDVVGKKIVVKSKRLSEVACYED